MISAVETTRGVRDVHVARGSSGSPRSWSVLLYYTVLRIGVYLFIYGNMSSVSHAKGTRFEFSKKKTKKNSALNFFLRSDVQLDRERRQVRYYKSGRGPATVHSYLSGSQITIILKRNYMNYMK